MGIFVHPLFNMAAVKDFPHDANRRPQKPSHLLGGHSFTDAGGNRVVGGRDGQPTGHDRYEHAETTHGFCRIGIFVILSEVKDLGSSNQILHFAQDDKEDF